MGRRRDKLLGSRRRQVLQLEDSDGRESFLAQHGYYPRYGEEEEEEMDVNAVFHFEPEALGEENMDCDSDDKLTEQEHSNEGETGKSARQNGSHGAGGDNSHGTIDSELANFMAEIDAISSVAPPPPPPDEGDTKPSAHSDTDSPLQEPPQLETETKAETPVEEELVTLDEPVTSWQQCLDENTECYYYWNTESNEVTWEIPADFSQYLLLVKQLEEKVSALQKQGKKVQVTGPSGTVSADGCVSKEEEPVAADPSEKDTVYGPFLPSRDSAENSVTSDKCSSKRKIKDSSSHGAGSEGKPSVENHPESVRSIGARVGMIQATGKLLSADYYDSEDEHSEEDEESKAKSGTVQEEEEEEEEEEGIDFDIDDIDRELELALERKQAELKKAEQTTETESKDKEKNSNDKHIEKLERRESQEDEKPKRQGSHEEEKRKLCQDDKKTKRREIQEDEKLKRRGSQEDEKLKRRGSQEDEKLRRRGSQEDEKPKRRGSQEDEKPKRRGSQEDETTKRHESQEDEKPRRSGSQEDEKPKRRETYDNEKSEERIPKNCEKADRESAMECEKKELSGDPSAVLTTTSRSDLGQDLDSPSCEKDTKFEGDNLEKDKKPGILKYAKKEDKSRTDTKEMKHSDSSDSVAKKMKKSERSDEKRLEQDWSDRKGSERKEDRKSIKEEKRSREERRSDRKEEKRSSEYKDKKKGHDRKEDKKGHRHKHEKEESSRKDKSRKNSEKRLLSDEEYEEKSHRKRSKHKHKERDREKEKYKSVESATPISMVMDYLDVERLESLDIKAPSVDKILDVKEEKVVDVQMEIEELSSTVLGKLEFLEVDKSGLTGLQILLISLETRMQDWKAGGLTSAYLHARLEEASTQLEQYEESAAPAGWLTHWDRTYRRYFYTNNRTGDSQWDYPDPDPYAEEVAAEHVGNVDAVPENKVNEDLDEQDCTEKAEDISEEPDKPEEEKSEGTADDDEDLPKNKKEEVERQSKPTIESDSIISVHPGEPPPPGMEEEMGAALPTTVPPISLDKYELSPAYSVDMDVEDSDEKPTIRESTSDIQSKEEEEEEEDNKVCKLSAVISRPPQLITGEAVLKPAIATAHDVALFPAFTTESIPVPSKSVQGPTAVNQILEQTTQAADGEKSTADSGQSSHKDKKKKKDKTISSSNLSLKKKKLSSLVQKWQQVQQEVEREEEKSKERDSYLHGHRYSP